MNDNECGKAREVIRMRKYVRISHFAHIKRLRDRPTEQPTNMTSYRSARTHLKRKFDSRVRYYQSLSILRACAVMQLVDESAAVYYMLKTDNQ